MSRTHVNPEPDPSDPEQLRDLLSQFAANRFPDARVERLQRNLIGHDQMSYGFDVALAGGREFLVRVFPR